MLFRSVSQSRYCPVKGQYAPVIGIFLNQFNSGCPLTIVGDGEQRRDFIHVSDIVSANIKSIQVDDYFNSEVFNIGSGYNYSINEISKVISNNVEYLPNRPGEAKNTLADINKIKNKINFKPTIDLLDWIKIKIKK